MSRILWIAVAAIIAVNIIVVGGVSVSAALEAIRKRRETRLDSRRYLRVAVGGNASPTSSLGPGGTLLGWAAIAALFVGGTLFLSPRARDVVSAALGVGSGAGLGSGELAVSAAGDPSAPRTGADGSSGSVPGGTDGRGSAGSTPDVSAGAALEGPHRVTAAAGSSTQIVVGWTSVSGATGYRIERSVDEVDWGAVGFTGADGNTHADSGLDPATTYYYRVVATIDGEETPPSDVTSATTIIEAPASPTLTAVGSADQIVLTWNDVAGATGYRVEQSMDGSTGWTIIANTRGDVPAYVHSGLDLATTYHYRIVATNAGGESEASNVQSVTTDTESAPPASEAPVPEPDPAGVLGEEAPPEEGGA